MFLKSILILQNSKKKGSNDSILVNSKRYVFIFIITWTRFNHEVTIPSLVRICGADRHFSDSSWTWKIIFYSIKHNV